MEPGTVQYRTVGGTVLYCNVPHWLLLRFTGLYITTLKCTVLYITTLKCTVFYYTKETMWVFMFEWKGCSSATPPWWKKMELNIQNFYIP
jgi:hypothetical protein